MPVRSFLTILLLLLALWLVPGGAEGQARKIAVLPVSNYAHLKQMEVDYLFDLIRETAIQNAVNLPIYLISKDLVANALEAASEGELLDEVSAASLGLSIGADLVIQSEVRRINRESYLTVKLLDTRDGSLVGMERAKGKGIAELEDPAQEAVRLLLRKIEEATPVKKSDRVPVSPHIAYYGELIVTAYGIQEGDDAGEPYRLKAEVSINGSKVGLTPFMDGLPEGIYQVVVAYGGAATHIEEVRITPGEASEVVARLRLPAPRADRPAREKQKQTGESMQQEARSRAWARAVDAWKERSRRSAEQRRRFLAAGIPLVACGVGLVVAGGVFVGYARDKDAKIGDLQADLSTGAPPAEIEAIDGQIRDAERARDRNAAMGISFLSVGGAALVTGVVLFALLPRLPEAPRPPAQGKSARLDFAPVLGPGLAGARLSVRF